MILLADARDQNNSLVTFRNIGYAAPPVDNLRFRAPRPPVVNRSSTQDHPDVMCPQAYPGWLVSGSTSPVNSSSIPPVDPRASEDCLFLDVLIPQSVWENRSQQQAPVLLWIPGGGYDVGWKDASGAGQGLIARSKGVILVSINYRLGLFVSFHLLYDSVVGC